MAAAVGKFFKLESRKTNLITELRGGTVTFLTMAYILAVNPSIIALTGGTCSSDDCTVEGYEDNGGGCIFTDRGYASCVDDVKTSLVTATGLSAAIACVIMGIGANLPISLAPGMGLNAYFAFNVVGAFGTGNVKYSTALAAIFVEGLIFIALAVTGMRGKIITYCPKSVMIASSVGIGFFLAHIGLQQGQGLGAVSYEPATLVTLGGCPLEDTVRMYTIPDSSIDSICTNNGTLLQEPQLGVPSANYMCTKNRMESATLWLGIVGGLIMAFLMTKKVKGAIMIGIMFVTIIAWIPGHDASYLGSHSLDARNRLHEFKKVVSAPSLKKTGFALDFDGFGEKDVWIALVTFLYVDFLDTTGTLFSMASHIGNYIPGFMDSEGQFEGSTVAFTSDGIATVIGSLFGTSPVTAYIESASGIKEGARTGIASLTTGFWFLVSLFFAPLLKSIPPYATGPALIVVGSMMMTNIGKINWNRIQDAVPAFLTIAIMPLTYSIAYGIIAGIASWIILNGVDYLATKAGWVTPEEDSKDTSPAVEEKPGV